MKSIHLHKVYAITKVKFQAFFGKNCIIMPLFAIGFTLVFRFLYQYVLGDGKMTDDLAAYVMSLGVVMNIGMTGIYCTSLLLAEEKEKKTLRVLMTILYWKYFAGSRFNNFHQFPADAGQRVQDDRKCIVDLYGDYGIVHTDQHCDRNACWYLCQGSGQHRYTDHTGPSGIDVYSDVRRTGGCAGGDFKISVYRSDYGDDPESGSRRKTF